MATVLPRQTRTGPVDTGDYDVSALADPNSNYIVTPICQAAVRDDATLVVPVQLLLDGKVVRDEVWHFGLTDRTGAAVVPSIAYSTGDVVPSKARFLMDLGTRSVSIGIDITLASRLR